MTNLAPPHDFGPEHNEFNNDLQQTPVEFALASVHNQLRERFSAFLAAGGNKVIANVDPVYDQAEAFEKEERFFKKVVGAALAMAERHNGPGDHTIITVLFDVDETILEKDETLTKHFPRPAFGLAMQELSRLLGSRINFGLLTTIKKRYIDEHIIPLSLGDASHFMNLDFALSVADEEKANLYEDSTYAKLEAVYDIIKPETIAQTLRGELSINRWFNSKALVLKQLVDANPDRAFILVDNLAPANHIRDDLPNIMGVYVGHEMLNHLMPS